VDQIRIEPQVTVLQQVSLMCQASGCEYPATHLFRSAAIVVAYCEFHAQVEADRIRVTLPMQVTKALHSGEFSLRSALERNSAA